MPSASQHRAWAIRNVQVYRELRRVLSPWRDWAMTILFYVAVHDVKAYFAANRPYFIARGEKLPATHNKIKSALRANPSWRTLATYYETFFGWSRRTRYGCWTPSEGDLAKARKQLRLVRSEIRKL